MLGGRLVIIPESSPLANLKGAEYKIAGLGDDAINEIMLRVFFDRIIDAVAALKPKAPNLSAEIDEVLSMLPERSKH